MVVFAPAGTNFDFDALLHQAIDAQHDGDDLEDYEIAPISLITDHPEATSPTSLPKPLPAIPTTLADPPPMGLTINMRLLAVHIPSLGQLKWSIARPRAKRGKS